MSDNTAANQSDEASTPPTSAHPASVVGILAQRRAEVLKEQFLDHRIPRWTKPEVWVRFAPVDHTTFKRNLDKVDKVDKSSKHNSEEVAEAEVTANADLLIKASREVFIVQEDGTQVGFGDDGAMLPIGDPATALALGLPPAAPATYVCRQLFITDGDILSAASRLTEWSGYKNADADEVIRGE